MRHWPRLSFGVQDFAPAVQQAIQRNQSEAETRGLYWAAREAGFDSINFDLVYGLPKQTVASFERTLQGVIDMLPTDCGLFLRARPGLRPNQKGSIHWTCQLAVNGNCSDRP